MPEPYQGASPNSKFLSGTVPASDTSWQSYAQRFAGSMLAHLLGLAIFLFVITRLPAASPAEIVQLPPPDITWIASPGPARPVSTFRAEVSGETPARSAALTAA